MAHFFPSMETISRLPAPPTEGEWALLRFLARVLDNTYEVYFQPHIQGDLPDVVIMRPEHGVLVIEVKDWHLDNYRYVDEVNWEVTDDGWRSRHTIRSPFYQVRTYKNHIGDFHLPGLAEQKAKEKNAYAVVRTMLYFHKERTATVKTFVRGKLGKNDRFTFLAGHDALTPSYFEEILSSAYLSQGRSKYFIGERCELLRQALQPIEYYETVGLRPAYTAKQKEIIESEKSQFKVKGCAGSGKSLTMAAIAVRAASQGKRVLILTYNITLRNYIHDLLRRAASKEQWPYVQRNVTVSHYHLFCTQYLNNNGAPVKRGEEKAHWPEILRFEDVPEPRARYNVVLVDEVQDFAKPWIQNIRALLPETGGRIGFFGDANQNIYDRNKKEKERVYTGVGGNWYKLDQSMRLSTRLARLAYAFQREFLSETYPDDDPPSPQQKLDFSGGSVHYIYREGNTAEENADLLVKAIGWMFRKNWIHPNDLCIIGDRFEEIRLLATRLKASGTEVLTMFEDEAVYRELEQQYLRNFAHGSESYEEGKEKLDQALYEIRRSKKYNFFMNHGTTKLCSTHSFKGWEITSLVLVLHEKADKGEELSPELLYTALTRCRKNLVIVNLGEEKYESFFRRELMPEEIVT